MFKYEASNVFYFTVECFLMEGKYEVTLMVGRARREEGKYDPRQCSRDRQPGALRRGNMGNQPRGSGLAKADGGLLAKESVSNRP